MPVTRKSTRSRGGAAAAAAQGKQQTLSFHHRVTKPTVKTGKDLVKEEEEETPETVTKTKTKDDIKVKDDVTEVPEAESHSEEEEEEEHEKKKKKKKQQPHAKVKKPANKAATKHVKEEPKQQEKKEHEPKRSEIELCALEIPQSAIDAYWNKIDSARMASTVHKKHTQDLTTGEKVLRYFDVSSHYGVSDCRFLSSVISASGWGHG